MSGLTFRGAVPADAGAVYELICDMESSRLPREEFERIFALQLAGENYLCLIAELGGETVGALNMRFEYQLHHAARIAEVMELSVAPAHRGRRIGAKLLAAARSSARENGCVQIELACNRLRTDAHRFYEREGMRPFHYKFSFPLYGDPGEDNALGR